MLINKSLSLGIILFLSACGLIYTSPNVKVTSDAVEVVKVTLQSVSYANKSPYTPKQLPDAFSQTANTTQAGIFGRKLDQSELSVQHSGISLPAPARPGPYKLGVADVVLLKTPPSKTTNALTALIASQNGLHGYTVQDDGAISIPDIGRISIADQTLEEAEATIFQTLVENQIDPSFSLEIIEFNARSVSVAGAVSMPRVIPIAMKPLTLQNALQIAGGVKSLTPEHTIIRIFRNGKQYQIPLSKLQTQPGLQSFLLKDADSIFVDNSLQKHLALVDARTQALAGVQINADLKREQSKDDRQAFLTKLELGAVKRDYIYLAGEVAEQGRFLLPFDNTASVADAIYSENGIRTREGNLSQVYILRASQTGLPITAYHLDAKNAVNLLLATKMQLRPNDIVFVAEQRVTAWNRVISQILPSFNVANLTDLIAK